MGTMILNSAKTARRTSWLTRPFFLRLSPAAWLLLGIIALAAFLNFYRLDLIGDGNEYYTAAVTAMQQSWRSFFFVAAEPGGSVTVDKPPLGLWLETLSAFIFGVNGFAVALPNILAGLISIPVLYRLTQKRFGAAAGLLAALALAVTPVAVAAQRNNTMDGMLTLALLLAAWAFLRTAETGELRHLLLATFVVGLGFNIKMLQAFLPLPAFFAVYWLGARLNWRRKAAHLAAATAVLLVVSFAWVMAVDLTPADARPYIGSSENNTVLELIIGHNGVSRLLGAGGPTAAQRPDDAAMPRNGNFPQPPNGAPGQRPPRGDNAFAPPAGDDVFSPPTGSGAPGGSGEVGDASVFRFWHAPLSKELSWLLPLALVGGLLSWLRRRPTLPLHPRHQFLLLFGGWLGIGLVFFSIAGFFHAYYLVMLTPPLAALVGAGAAELWELAQTRWRLATAVLLLTTALTLAYQGWNAAQFGGAGGWFMLALAPAGVGTAVWLWRGRAARWGMGLLLAAMLVTPLVWSYWTAVHVDNVNLPGAYDGDTVAALPGAADARAVDADLVAYLQAQTQDVAYLAAVPSAMQGAQLVLATERPVLYMGGFSGSDPVVNAGDLAQMVADGELRYVMLSSGGRGGPGGLDGEIATWVTTNCMTVADFIGMYQCVSE